MNKKKIKQTFIILAVVTSLFIVVTSRSSFLNYERNIVLEQQEQLLTISKLVGRSLVTFTKEQVAKVNYLGENIAIDIGQGNDHTKSRLESFNSINREQILNLEYIDFTKELLYEEKLFPSFRTIDEFNLAMRSNKTIDGVYIGEAYEVGENSYGFELYKPIYVDGELVSVVIARVGINNMYDLIARPIKVGQYGYVMVKDSDGIIIMHPLKEQVGYDVLIDRKKKHPELDYRELEELVEKQISGLEGSYIYHSYWWPQEKLEKVKKFQSFTSVNITNKFWVVAVTMSYDEIAGAIRKYLHNITVVALTLISIIAIGIFIILRMISSEEAHKIEVNYLKEINESSESLRKKELQLHERKKAETIGTLTGGIAHEFNNILTPIMGYSEMILMEVDKGDDIYDGMKIINDSSKRAGDVIGEILKFSGNKNIKAEYEFLEIERVVERALKFFEIATPSNVNVIKIFNKDLGSVFANEAQIYQVLLDLCISAYSLMKEDGGQLEIGLIAVDKAIDSRIIESGLDDKEYVKLVIGDRERTLENRVRTSVLKDELSSASEIIIRHGGKLLINNAGTNIFEVYIPKSRREDKAIEIEEALRGKERILVIDDEELIVEMLKKTLGELGYKVIAYTDPSEVVKNFNTIKEKVDIVISDVRMPEVTGIQIAKKFKRNKPEVRVILMTANTEEPLEEYIQSHIIDDYILKPVSVRNISKKIRKVVEKV